MLPEALTAALESAINAYLALDPETLERMARLEGKVIGIHWRNTDKTLYFLPAARSLQLLVDYAGEADTLLVGNPLALAELGLGGDKSRALFSGEVEIQGDTETGQQFQAILEAMDIDWEEHLSRLLGDVAAHQLGKLGRNTQQRVRETGRTLQQNLGEYLQEESRVVPTRIEVDNFSDAVDQLRMNVDRLEARVQRLLTQHDSTGTTA